MGFCISWKLDRELVSKQRHAHGKVRGGRNIINVGTMRCERCIRTAVGLEQRGTRGVVNRIIAGEFGEGEGVGPLSFKPAVIIDLAAGLLGGMC